MPLDNARPGSARDWLERAKGDFAIAMAPLPEGAFLEDLCFHAQQAAEKAIKAIYVRHALPFRYTHDLDELLTGLKRFGISVPDSIQETVVLTGYAWEARYPAVTEPVTEQEYREAVELAKSVLAWAEKLLL